MDEIRHKKLEEQLREEIAALIVRGEVKDPRVGPFVSVTRVEAARDVSHAKVYVSTFAAVARASAEGEDTSAALATEEGLDLAVAGLQSAAGFIQAQIARRVRLRLTPKLHFVADHGIKQGFDLNEKMKGLFS